MPTNQNNMAESLVSLLLNEGLVSGNQWQITPLGADGSSRRFFRIIRPSENPLSAYCPRRIFQKMHWLRHGPHS